MSKIVEVSLKFEECPGYSFRDIESVHVEDGVLIIEHYDENDCVDKKCCFPIENVACWETYDDEG